MNTRSFFFLRSFFFGLFVEYSRAQRCAMYINDPRLESNKAYFFIARSHKSDVAHKGFRKQTRRGPTLSGQIRHQSPREVDVRWRCQIYLQVSERAIYALLGIFESTQKCAEKVFERALRIAMRPGKRNEHERQGWDTRKKNATRKKCALSLE